MFERFMAWFITILCKCGMHDWHGEIIDGMLFEKCSECGELRPYDNVCED